MGDLHAYFVQRDFQGNMVIVPVEIPYMSLLERHAAFVAREIPKRDFRLPPDVEDLAYADALPPPLQMPPEERDAFRLVEVAARP